MNKIHVVTLVAVAYFCAICETCTRNGVSCPNYTVVEKHEGYEDRLYPSLFWVSTSGVASARDEISKDLIKRLYGYLGGANDRNSQVDMMVPVRTSKVALDDTNRYTMSIALSPPFQEDPPNPTDPLVTMEKEPSIRYVTRSFTGVAKEESIWDEEAENLIASTIEDDAVNVTFYYRSVYDSPWREHDRLNEVWLLKQNSSSGSSEESDVA